jgi:hypothetical protein
MPSLASRDLVGFLVAKIIDKVYSTIWNEIPTFFIAKSQPKPLQTPEFQPLPEVKAIFPNGFIRLQFHRCWLFQPQNLHSHFWIKQDRFQWGLHKLPRVNVFWKIVLTIIFEKRSADTLVCTFARANELCRRWIKVKFQSNVSSSYTGGQEFPRSFRRQILLLHLFFKVHQLAEFEIQQSQGLSRTSKKNKFRIALEGLWKINPTKELIKQTSKRRLVCLNRLTACSTFCRIIYSKTKS